MSSLSALPDLVFEPPALQTRIDAEPDTTVHDDKDNVWAEHYLRRPEQVLRFPGLADFLVTPDVDAVRAIASPHTDEHTVRMLWATQVVPLLRTRMAGVVLHGCAVQVHQRAVAFLGASGAGKSTLSAYLAAHGSPLLSDDVLWVRSVAGQMVVQPSEPTLRLWQDSEDALEAALRAIRLPDVSYTTKGQFKLGQRFAICAEPLPLSAIFVLSRNAVAEPVIGTRGMGEAVTDLVQHSFLLDRSEASARAAHFVALTELAASVPIFSLDFPRRYDALEAVRTAILSYLHKEYPSVTPREI
jgi:ABC-type taurine transport system ATPase subunit